MFIFKKIKKSIENIIQEDIENIDCNLKKNIIKSKLNVENLIKFLNLNINNQIIKEQLDGLFTTKFIFILNFFNKIMININKLKDFKLLINFYTVYFSCFKSLYHKLKNFEIEDCDIVSNLLYVNNSNDLDIKFINSNLIYINNLMLNFEDYSQAQIDFKMIFSSIYLKQWPIITLNTNKIITEFLLLLVDYLENLQEIDVYFNKEFTFDKIIDKKDQIFIIFKENIWDGILINLFKFQRDSELSLLNSDLKNCINILNNENLENYEDIILYLSKSY